jgi:hypothetical protein
VAAGSQGCCPPGPAIGEDLKDPMVSTRLIALYITKIIVPYQTRTFKKFMIYEI